MAEKLDGKERSNGPKGEKAVERKGEEARGRGSNSSSGSQGASRSRRARLGSNRSITQSTEDEQLLNRVLPAEPMPQAPELGAFAHGESWRVLRIQSEFVYGINALAEVGAAVAVFGSARFGESHPMYEPARKLGRLLAEAGFAVITGGGPGIMEAANRGAYEAGGLSIGCNIELPFEQISESLPRSLHQLPLLLRAEDHVREVLRGVRHLPGRVRHPR